SQSWCSTRPKEMALARTPANAARPIRLRSTILTAARQIAWIFLTVWPSIIPRSPRSILAAAGGTMSRGGITRTCDVPRQRRLIAGGFVDQQLKQLMKELGEAINES